MDIAKIFWSGRSQAVRLPKDFRFDASEVRIRRHGNAVILEPVAHDWAWLDALAGKLDEDFVNAASEKPKQRALPWTSSSADAFSARHRSSPTHPGDWET